MGLYRHYSLTCDGCGKVHTALTTTPARARSAARHDGWARRKVKAGQERNYRKWEEQPDGKWIMVRIPEGFLVDVYANRDFCPTCLEKMEQDDGPNSAGL